MTYEEVLNDINQECVICLTSNNCIKEECVWFNCKKAIEKQIPKKPNMWMNGKHLECYECPNCGCTYDFDTDGFIKFCHECGQRIKIYWSEE